MSYIQNKLDELVEILAEKEHDRWAHWQKYMHERVYDSSQSINPHLKVIPTEDYNRWERQLNTPYSELSEKEKESDREQVRKYLPIIEQALTDYHNHIVDIIKRHYPANIESMQLLINRLDCILGRIQNGYVVNGELQDNATTEA